MTSLVIFIAVFAVVGNMPILAAKNNSNVSVNASINVSTDDNEDSDDEKDDDNNDEDEGDVNDSDDDEKEGQGKGNEKEGRGKDDGKGGQVKDCIIKVEQKISDEDGKRVLILKKKMKCVDGTESEFEMKIENSTKDGKYKEKMKYKFGGEELEVEAEDEIDLEENTTGNYSLKAKMRNGNFTRIKIMPDQASEIALERLKALNFTVQLRERLHNNVPQVVYNIEANKNGRFLGIFKLAMKVNAEIDPETGEVLDVNTPWWAFLVTGEDACDKLKETNYTEWQYRCETVEIPVTEPVSEPNQTGTHLTCDELKETNYTEWQYRCETVEIPVTEPIPSPDWIVCDTDSQCVEDALNDYLPSCQYKTITFEDRELERKLMIRGVNNILCEYIEELMRNETETNEFIFKSMTCNIPEEELNKPYLELFSNSSYCSGGLYDRYYKVENIDINA